MEQSQRFWSSSFSRLPIRKKNQHLLFKWSQFRKIAKRLNLLVQHNKQHHRTVLLSSFHLNGHALGFHPQTQTLAQPYKQRHRKVLLSSFYFNSLTTKTTACERQQQQQQQLYSACMTINQCIAESMP